jgi:RHS repeat-associated protein
MPTTTYAVFDGEIISENRAGVQHDYVSDPLGNTIALLDNTQTQTDQWAYFPYGESVRLKGTTATPMTYVGNKSCRQDSSAIRSYMLNRSLDMPKAKWMTEDPIGFYGGDWNLYTYVVNAPTNKADPSGLQGSVGSKCIPIDINPITGQPYPWPCIMPGLGCWSLPPITPVPPKPGPPTSKDCLQKANNLQQCKACCIALPPKIQKICDVNLAWCDYACDSKPYNPSCGWNCSLDYVECNGDSITEGYKCLTLCYEKFGTKGTH